GVVGAFAGVAKGVDLKVSSIDLYRSGIGDFGNDIDACERSMTPLVCIERRNPDEPMHAALGLKVSIRVLAAYQQSDRFDADFFALLNVHGLRLKAASLNPALIHPQQHVGPITRLGAAGTRVNC